MKNDNKSFRKNKSFIIINIKSFNADKFILFFREVDLKINIKILSNTKS